MRYVICLLTKWIGNKNRVNRILALFLVSEAKKDEKYTSIFLLEYSSRIRNYVKVINTEI